jgi:ribonuclease P protein component
MRLSRARDIERVFRNGRKFSNAYVTVRARKRGARLPPRLGFAIARKHVGSAVRRNRIKRIARESFRHHSRILQGFDVVLVSRRGLDQAEPSALRVALDAQWGALNDHLGISPARSKSAMTGSLGC